MTTDIQEFDFSVDLLRALLWEYNEAANLQALLEAKSEWYQDNQTDFWNSWYTNVFNLATANEFGLSVWSAILNLPLFSNSAPIVSGPVFGFDNQTGFNFNNSNFGDNNGNTYELPIETKRIALKLRYFQITSSGTVPEINRVLKYVFADYGRAWLEDYHDMTQGYIFDFPLTFDLRYLFNNYDILPRPAGVASAYFDATIPHWGFAPGDLNFNNGNFGA